MPRKGKASSEVGLLSNSLPREKAKQCVKALLENIALIDKAFRGRLNEFLSEDSRAKGNQLILVGISVEPDRALNLVYANGAGRDNLLILAINENDELDVYPVIGASLTEHALVVSKREDGGAGVCFGKAKEGLVLAIYTREPNNWADRARVMNLLVGQKEIGGRVIVVPPYIGYGAGSSPSQTHTVARMAVDLLGDQATTAFKEGYGLE